MNDFFDIVGTEQRVYYPCQCKLGGTVYNCINLLTREDSENKCKKCSGNLVCCTCGLSNTCVTCLINNNGNIGKCPRVTNTAVDDNNTVYFPLKDIILDYV